MFENVDMGEEVLIKKMKKNFVKGRGNPNKPEFLILGEAPGRKENEQGTPFVGRSGKVLDEWLELASVSDFYIDNVFPFMPLDSLGKIRRPSKKELEENKPVVDENIKRIQPKHIIVLGDSAADSLLKMKTNVLIGKVEYYQALSLTGIYHPARYIRLGTQRTDGKIDFINAVNLLRNN